MNIGSGVSGGLVNRCRPVIAAFRRAVRKESASTCLPDSLSRFRGPSSLASLVVDLGVAAAVINIFWFRGSIAFDGRLRAVFVAVLISAVLVRWRLPRIAFAVSLIVTVIGWGLGFSADPLLAAAWCLYPQAVRRGTWLQSLGAWLVVPLILLPATFGGPVSEGIVRRIVGGCLAIGASWMLGCAEAHRLASAQEAAHQRGLARRAQQQVSISREVHDVVGHALSVIRAEADVARSTASDKDELLRSLADIEERAGGALEEVQQLVRTLRADEVGYSGAPSLPELLTAARVSGLEVEADVEIPALSAATQAVVSRVVQEALSNVVRHSDASSCSVTAEVDAGATAGSDRGILTVRVDDNGTGLPAHQAPGAGLTGMRERVEAIGGTLSVSGLPQGGTRVLARLPLQVES